MMTMTLSRRTALAAAGGLAVAGVAGVAGCQAEGPGGGPGSGPGSSAPPAGVVLPTYQAYPDSPFDFEPTPEGGLGGVYEFPSEDQWVPLNMDGVAEGEKIDVFGPAPGGGAPPAPEKNSFLQAIQSKMDGELNIMYVPTSGDLADKFATLVAGNELPDLCKIMPMPNLTSLLESKFTDLTEHLSGDAALDYPFLANFPERAWQSAVFNGKIYGVPRYTGALGSALMIRTDNVDVGEVELNSGEDFLALCREVTDPKSGRWAITRPQVYLPFLEECLGGVNGWQRLEDGSFVHSYQTEQYVEALSILRQMWADGLVHPDAYGQAGSGFVQLPQGTVSLHWSDFAQWGALLRNNLPVDPNFNVTGILPPAWHGGDRPRHFTGPGISTVTGITESDPERVKLLLRVLNWLASPFGTEEQVLLSYGVKDEHFTLKDGLIQQTELAAVEMNIGIVSIAGPPSTLWAPGVRPDDVSDMYDYQTSLLSDALDDDSIGLFSPTELKQGATLKPRMDDMAVNIITGRAEVSQWQDSVDDWLAGGGQEMADEYRDAWEQANS